MIEPTMHRPDMKQPLPPQRIPVAGKASAGFASRRLPAAARSTVVRDDAKPHCVSTTRVRQFKQAPCVYDLRIFATIGREVVEVLWDRAVDDPTEILVRGLDGATFQRPIHLLDDVQLLR